MQGQTRRASLCCRPSSPRLSCREGWDFFPQLSTAQSCCLHFLHDHMLHFSSHKCLAVEIGMFCPRPFVDEGCQVPAAPAAEPSTVPGQIFSREKQLSHSSLRCVPTSPAARGAREFTEDRRSHSELAGLGWFACLQTSLSQRKASPWLRICRQRALREGLVRLREGRVLTCLSTRQSCFGMLLQHGGETPAGTGGSIRKWSFEAHCGVLSQLWGRSRTKVAADGEETEG